MEGRNDHSSSLNWLVFLKLITMKIISQERAVRKRRGAVIDFSVKWPVSTVSKLEPLACKSTQFSAPAHFCQRNVIQQTTLTAQTGWHALRAHLSVSMVMCHLEQQLSQWVRAMHRDSAQLSSEDLGSVSADPSEVGPDLSGVLVSAWSSSTDGRVFPVLKYYWRVGLSKSKEDEHWTLATLFTSRPQDGTTESQGGVTTKSLRPEQNRNKRALCHIYDIRKTNCWFSSWISFFSWIFEILNFEKTA